MSLMKSLRCCLKNYSPFRQLSSSVTKIPMQTSIIEPISRNLEIDWISELQTIKREEQQQSAIEPVNEEEKFKNVEPPLNPSFNLAAYVNKSATLQQLLKLGTNLNRLEKKSGLGQFILKLDFEKDIKNHLLFLNKIGIPTEHLGIFISQNPLIFREDLADLETRINYLEAKKFTKTEITRIVSLNPFWLMFKTQRIDNRLGFFQKKFDLNGQEVRYLGAKQPKLITFKMETIQKNTFSIKEEMGFDANETKNLLLNVPRIWMLDQGTLLERFDCIHKTMKISHQQLLQSPEILYTREFRIRQRHEFLESLNRAQYDPWKDLYISLKSLVEGTDAEFAVNVAKSTPKNFNAFLRTR